MVLLGIIGGQELLIIAVIILILFGGRKIPELMRGLGRGVKEFKDGMNGVVDDKNQDDTQQKTQEKKKTTEEVKQ